MQPARAFDGAAFVASARDTSPLVALLVFDAQMQQLGAKTIKKNTNSTQNKSQTHRAKQYEVTSFLSTDCELSKETCSKNVYSLDPLLPFGDDIVEPDYGLSITFASSESNTFGYACLSLRARKPKTIAPIYLILFTRNGVFI